MPSSILVAFSTIHGSTQKVADKVAATLREQGLAVDLLPAKQARSLDPYRAVVLGAPLYMFHWHRDALNFLSKHRAVLAQKPVAIFALGPINNVEKEFQDARAMLDKELTKFNWLSPVAIEVMASYWEEIYRILQPGCSAYLFDTRRDFEEAAFRHALQATLRQDNLLGRWITPHFLRRQLRMAYRVDEIAEIAKCTQFAPSFAVDKITLRLA